MVDPDVVLEKVASIRQCLRRIGQVTGLNSERLENEDVRDIYVLNLQRAVQSAIDLAGHVVSDEGLGLPSSLKETFSLLQGHGIVQEDLAKRMMAMVGFRNIAVHEYRALDLGILKSILTDHLDELEAFCQAILSHCQLDGGG